MPTAAMYDATDPAAIPDTADAVAGYVDGSWNDFNALRARFPGKPVVSITATGEPGARVGDVETGDLSPTSGANWAKNELAHGRRPTLYYSRDRAGEVGAALGVAGVALSDVDFWVADWTYTAHMVPGSVATQWANPPRSGGDYDISEADTAWLTDSIATQPAPPPSPGPAPQPTGGFMPPTITTGSLSGAVRSCQVLLNLHNAGLSVDGVFGPKTEQAVKNFQTVFHLTADGIVGPVTWSALDTFG